MIDVCKFRIYSPHSPKVITTLIPHSNKVLCSPESQTHIIGDGMLNIFPIVLSIWFYNNYIIVIFTKVWKYWVNYQTFELFSPLLSCSHIQNVHIYMYFVHSSISNYWTFTRFVGQCPVWLTISIPLCCHLYVCVPNVDLLHFF